VVQSVYQNRPATIYHRISFRTPCEQNNLPSTQLQRQNDVFILAPVDLVVIAKPHNRQSTFKQLQNAHISMQQDLRSSILTRIPLPTAHPKGLIDKRVAVNIANSPVQNPRIRARAQDQLRRLGRPVPVVLRDAQAVADADDLGGPVAAGAFDFERADGGFGTVDVGEEDGFGAVVEDELRRDGVGGGGCEG
jgi:hypothetical protein